MRHSFVSSVESDLLLTGVILEGLTLRKFVFDVVVVVFNVCAGTDFVD